MSLVGKPISETYAGLLTVNSSNTPIGPTVQIVKDGLGNETALGLSDNTVSINGTVFPPTGITAGLSLVTDGDGSIFWGIPELIVDGGNISRPLDKKLNDNISIFDLVDLNADGVTDDRAALQTALDYFERLATIDSYIDGEIEIDLKGKSYAISGPLKIDFLPWTKIKNGKLIAIGTWDINDYMLNCTGDDANANTGLHIDIGLECEDKARGIYLENAYRSKISAAVNRFQTVGIFIGSNCNLAQIGGIYHEREGNDADFNTDNRSATGIWIGSGGGDIYVNAKVGWTHRCVYNQATGPVHIAGHFYCSSQPVPIYGILLEVDSNTDTIVHQSYLDTGDIVYRGGRLHFADDNRMFHLGGVTPPELTAYIQMIATVPNQSHLITFNTDVFSDRAKPLVRVVETGGNNWINVPNEWKSGQYSFRNAIDTIIESMASTSSNIVKKIISLIPGAYVEFRDSNTTLPQGWGPMIGADANQIVLRTNNTNRYSHNGSNHILDLSTLPEFVDDNAAETAGLTLGMLYRTGSVVKIRIPPPTDSGDPTP